ncbi:MAG TPA: transglycosylase domain-containing protein [Actinoplanes sp.]|nr:transglycosylase domain-containing protein [Actinoplanes sp.]
MNPYGEPQPARARASVPRPSGGNPPPDDDLDAYRQPPSRPAGGRASVSGSVPMGTAPVGPPPAGRASVGMPAQAPAGRASVAPPVGAAADNPAWASARAGSGAAGDTGGYGVQQPRAVARASVRRTPGYNGMGELGGPAGGGPGGNGPRGGGGGGGGRFDPTGDSAKRRRRTNILTASAAVLVILLGVGVVGGTYFFDDVSLPEPKTDKQTTQVFYSDGKSAIATIGEQNRSVVPVASINKVVKQAVMAAEDKNFLEHGGIDMKGIARAAWNNFTGGETQGASTITQQYARYAAELKEISYNRKLREAVIARKMESTYGKEEILGRYLNAVYFGRGAYGVEAAAKAYYNKSVVTPAGQKNAITVGEAAVLAAVIKQPEATPGGHQGYDPSTNPGPALERWNYTLSNMVEKGWLAASDRPTKIPMTIKYKAGSCGANCNNNQPSGKIVKYVIRELEAMGIPKEKWQQGGLQVTTTIDKKAQDAAEEAVKASDPNSPLHGLPKTYRPAVVAVNPTNGRVVAYYGGPDRVGWDYAGPNYSEDTGDFLGGGRPPGSSFKIYTLLAGLKDGYDFDTTWDAEKKNKRGQTISNADRQNLNCDKRRCPLEKATVESYNFPFYWLADSVRPHKVLEAAHAAGINRIKSGKGEFIDLSKKNGEDLNRDFDNEVGFGQYEVFPYEHASGIATIAAGGVRHKSHFVMSVKERDPKTGQFKPIRSEKLESERVFDRSLISDLDFVLKQIPGRNSLRDGRQAIAKTGTWEYKDGKTRENGDAWMVGAVPQLAAAVWVGNYSNKNVALPIKLQNGRNMTGGSVPGAIWKRFMDKAVAAMDLPPEPFPERIKTVGTKEGNGLPPLVVEPPQQDCAIPIFCNNNGNNNGQPGTPLPSTPTPGTPDPGVTDPGNQDPGNQNPGNNERGNNGNGGGGGNGKPRLLIGTG